MFYCVYFHSYKVILPVAVLVSHRDQIFIYFFLNDMSKAYYALFSIPSDNCASCRTQLQLLHWRHAPAPCPVCCRAGGELRWGRWFRWAANYCYSLHERPDQACRSHSRKKVLKLFFVLFWFFFCYNFLFCMLRCIVIILHQYLKWFIFQGCWVSSVGLWICSLLRFQRKWSELILQILEIIA